MRKWSEALPWFVAALAAGLMILEKGFCQSSTAWTELPFAPRHAAMGGALVATAWGCEEPYANPAAIGSSARAQLGVASVSWLAGTRAQQVVFAQPGRTLAWAVWGALINVPGIERRTARDERIGEFAAHHLRAGAGLGRTLGAGLRAGIAAEWLFQKIDVYEAGAILLDLGLQEQELPGGLSVALAVKNVGIGKKLGQGLLKPRTAAALGLARQWAVGGREDALVTEADLAYWRGQWQGSFGLEVRPYAALAIRGGFLAGVELRGWSLGIGVGTGRLGLDYAFLPLRKGFGEAHCFGVVLSL
jgi:hypothetical protein